MFPSSERFDLTTINVTQKLDISPLERLDLGFPAIKDQQFQSDPFNRRIDIASHKFYNYYYKKSSKNLSFQKENFFIIRTWATLIQYVVYSMLSTVYGAHKPISRSLNGPFLQNLSKIFIKSDHMASHG